jgi:hypothetical protein
MTNPVGGSLPREQQKDSARSRQVDQKPVEGSTSQAADEQTVFRSGGQQLVFIGLGLLFAVLGAIIPLVRFLDGYVGAAVIELVLFLTLSWFFFYRCARAGVFFDDEGVRIVNPRRTFRFASTDIARFVVGQRGFFPRIGMAELQDGRCVGAFGIQGPNPDTRPDNRDAEELVTALNVRLRKAHAQSL